MILKSFVGVWAEVNKGVDFRIPTDVTSVHLPSIHHRHVAKIPAGENFLSSTSLFYLLFGCHEVGIVQSTWKVLGCKFGNSLFGGGVNSPDSQYSQLAIALDGRPPWEQFTKMCMLCIQKTAKHDCIRESVLAIGRFLILEAPGVLLPPSRG